ncbi:non-SMC mitotic condensation complex subunit 1 domain-containing protein [Ditylenchus destructor]|uniref:AP complex subunit beta n=1 Tax=Ditylenchus destructor TaxID=166010 RepID=A0AAD4RDR2_9BILA|nr:non-SMC mitotic condensation complex subunit 1 domain-containing protein [Ditylenchus destructor]
MTDSKYFTTTKKGEIFELKTELNSEKKEKKREAVKKVIASMTVGKDVSALFPDVVNCMQTDNVELKKLVYLYLMNYAKSQPELAIMAVNTFVKDCEDPNPLIRALAVRTMGCIRVDKVVANAVAAISEINETKPLIEINLQTVNKLLTALNECTEWGQVFILDALANYQPKDEREAQNICERISPRLAHANAAVVLSTVKVLMKLINVLPESSDFVTQLVKKLAPPMVTLLSAEPEIQYVALRNINLIVQKRPDILKQEMKVFFVKYNDPIYVKMEKLDIMIRLAQQSNIAQVLSELKEYAAEVDVDFVRKAVRAIGRCAIKVEQSAEKCVTTLLDLIQTKVNYVVQEAVVVIKDIFRKYPNKYEGIISTLCENLDTLDEPEARASMIWIIGEYAERIDNADELLESFVDGFHDENTQVQLQLLTAVVKLFLKRPGDTQQLVQRVLSLATQDSDNPDLRDRGYIYWRLLSADPAAAKEVVLAEKPLISEETDLLEPSLLSQLVCHIGSLASVYHKPPSSFVDPIRQPLRGTLQQPGITVDGAQPNVRSTTETAAAPSVIPNQDSIIADLLNLDLSAPVPAPTAYQPASTGLDDLLGLGPPTASAPNAANMVGATSPPNVGGSALGGLDILSGLAPAVPPTVSAAPIQDTTGLFSAMPQQPSFGLTSLSPGYTAPHEILLDAIKGKGLQVEGTFSRRGGIIYMDITFTNKAMQQMSQFAIQFNSNSFGLVPAEPLQVQPINPNQSTSVTLACRTNGPVLKMEPLNNLQVAVKNNFDVHYFAVTVPLFVYFEESGQMDKRDFLQLWKEIPEQNEVQFSITNTYNLSADDICSKLQQNNIFTVARRNVDGQELLYHSIKYTNQIYILSELKMQQNNPSLTLSLKSRHLTAIANINDIYQALLSHP